MLVIQVTGNEETTFFCNVILILFINPCWRSFPKLNQHLGGESKGREPRQSPVTSNSSPEESFPAVLPERPLERKNITHLT